MESKMRDSHNHHPEAIKPSSALHAWKEMSPAEFEVLGANALVYIRPIAGRELAILLADRRKLDRDQIFLLVVSADGSPLLVTESLESANEWLDETSLAVATVH
jgi:hypothetical protein